MQWLSQADARRLFNEALSLQSRETLAGLWLCHADARQVYDLPTSAPIFLRVFDRRA
jgi:hypothetical protein